MIKLTPAQKKLLYTKVHFSKSISSSLIRGYELIRNPKDNNLYYVKDDKGKYFGKATENPKTWKLRIKQNLYDEGKQRSGFVASIVYNYLFEVEYPEKTTPFFHEISDCSFCVRRTYEKDILIAIIYFKNEYYPKRVPLDCIKEYEGFCNGKETEEIIMRIKAFMEKQSPSNIIQFNQDGTVRIEGKDFYQDSDLCVHERPHGLLLDIKNRNVQFLSEKDDEWFNITDSEFKEIISVLKRTIKEEAGFEPSVIYGATNFDKLVNFTKYPFAPEINEFSKIMGKSFPANFIKNDANAVKSFIEYCGIPYSPAVNTIFLQGHRKFAQFLGIWGFGYRNFQVIEKIMSIDKEMFFAEAAFSYGKISSFIKDNRRRTGFHFVNMNFPLAKLKLLTIICDEKTSIRLLAEIFEKNTGWIDSYHASDYMYSYLKFPDAYVYLCKLYKEGALSQDVINKIIKEGFTKYNHDMLMKIWEEKHPDGIENFINIKISYSQTERKLEYESNGFKFCLPEDTRKLVDIGAKMNICVGHLYRDKAVKKQCTIVYVERDSKYEMCIELKKKQDSFTIVQVSEFSNQKVQGINWEVLKEWQKFYGIDWPDAHLI